MKTWKYDYLTIIIGAAHTLMWLGVAVYIITLDYNQAAGL